MTARHHCRIDTWHAPEPTQHQQQEQPAADHQEPPEQGQDTKEVD